MIYPHPYKNVKFVVKPKKGDALLFFSLYPNATIDVSSLHESCPVIEGEKWSATKWIHVRNFEKFDITLYNTSDDCKDNHASCATWAADGECKTNHDFMVGSSEGSGYCRKSCKVC